MHRPTCVDFETLEDDVPHLMGYGTHPDNVRVGPPHRLEGDRWVAHSINADRRWARIVGFDLSGRRDDTMLKSHLLDENQPMSLKHLAPHYLGLPIWFSEIESRLSTAKKRHSIPPAAFAEYCAQDVRAELLLNTYCDAHLTPPLRRIYEHLSLPLNDVLFEASQHGVLLDHARLAALAQDETHTEGRGKTRRLVYDHRSELRARLDDLATTLDALAGRALNWRSQPQVARVLYQELGCVVPEWLAARHESDTPTGLEILRAIRGQHPLIAKLIEHRELEQQRRMLNTWLSYLDCNDRMHPEYDVAGTMTGRISGRHPNPQNIPTDDWCRRLFVAPEGMAMVVADYTTIEFGVAAWLFQEPRMLEAYLAQMQGGPDVHTQTATYILGRPPKDKEERKRHGKTPNFGLLYKQGVRGYRAYAGKSGLDLSDHQAQADRTRWHETFPNVRQGWRLWTERAYRDGQVTLPSGRVRRFPELREPLQDWARMHAEVQTVNAPVQGTAAEFTHAAAIIADGAFRARGGRLVLHVHDSIGGYAPLSAAAELTRDVKYIMEQEVPRYLKRHLGMEIPIPLRAEVGTGPNWADLTSTA